MSIGENIKKARKSKKMTQKELAKFIGKSERMVQKYEKGEIEPSFETLEKIAGTLEVFVFEFLDDNVYVTSSENSVEIKKYTKFDEELIRELLKTLVHEEELKFYNLFDDDYTLLLNSIKHNLIANVKLLSIKNNEIFDAMRENLNQYTEVTINNIESKEDQEL